MTNNIKIIGVILLSLFILSGCIKDGQEDCPDGTVRLNLYAEKFRNRSQNPLDDREPVFNNIISHLRYYLYRDDILREQGLVTNFTKSSADHYAFDFTGLEYGNYKMVIVANSSKTALSGDYALADNLVITYPGALETEDFFTAVFPFTVNSSDPAEYEVGLLRTQGVIRYTFKNMPANISDIEMVMRNVCSEKWVTGDYKKTCEASRRYIIPLLRQTTTEDYIVGAFPNLIDQKAAYYLNIYRNRESEPYLRQLITDTLTVIRNQLLDIAVTFNNGNLDFEIDMDSKWDGSSSGGETGLE